MHDSQVSVRLRARAALAALAAAAGALCVVRLSGSWPFSVNVQTVHALFQNVVWEGIPFLLVGALFAAVIEQRWQGDRIAILLHEGAGGRIMAGLCGAALPICDCGAIALARTLRRKGVSESVAFTFALSTPTVNLIALAATLVAFHGQWQWVAARVAGAFFVAIVAGWLVRSEESVASASEYQPAHPAAHRAARPGGAWFPALADVCDHASGELFAIGPYFVVSAMLAAFAQTLLPTTGLATFGWHSAWTVPAMMVAGSLLSLCSSADAFVAAALTGLLPPGAILAFLLAGQMIDVRNLALFPRAFSRRVAWVGLSAAACLILCAGYGANVLLTGGWA